MMSRSARAFDPRRALRRSLPALFGFFGLLLPAHARAETPELVELTWDAPPGCPSAEQVRAKIRRLAGPLTEGATRLSANATIERKDEDELQLRLVIHSGDVVGERNIDAKSCDDLAGATAVALALLLHSSTALAASDLAGAATTPPGASAPPTSAQENPNKKTEPPGAAEKPGISAPQPAPGPKAEVLPPRSRPFLLQLPLGAASVGPFPKPSLGVAFAAGVALERWRLLAEGTLWRKQTATTTYLLDRYEVDIAHFSATLRGCRALSLSRFEFAPCLTLALEHISARGSGPHIVTHFATSTWLAPGVGAELRFYVASWLSLVAAADAQFESARPRISLAGIGSVEQLSAAAARITIGPEWIL